VRVYEWLYVPFSLIFLVAFRFAEHTELVSLPRWLRYAAALSGAALLFWFATLLVVPLTNERHAIAGARAAFFSGTLAFWVSTVAAVVYSSLMRSRRAQMAFDEAAVQRARSRRRISAARLATQQARLEPTFLFGSLELIETLYEGHAGAAEATLASLIGYLRAALPKIGEEESTLGREIRLSQTYLEIVRGRMGSRLATRIEVAPELEEALFPAMTLVPLVEHAVRYGLEPVPLGGRLEIHAERKADRLEVTVRQDGVYGGPGETSLDPLRERLFEHYGSVARLGIAIEKRGSALILEVPWETGAKAKTDDGGMP
jgi:LytS/YehU family sensor histidine kinase